MAKGLQDAAFGTYPKVPAPLNQEFEVMEHPGLDEFVTKKNLFSLGSILVDSFQSFLEVLEARSVVFS